MFGINKNLFIFLILSNFIFSQENYEVTGVSVEGNETIDDETILNTIAFTSTGWFSKYILREEPFLFNSEILSSDISNVVKLYQREGFLLVKVNAEQITDDENKNIEVVFRIDEGPPVTVTNVNINLNSSFDTGKVNTDSLKSLAFNSLTLTAGKRFRDEDIRTDETLITGYYINNGYPHVKINFILNVDTANFLVSVNWFVDPGELSTFGKTSVSGLDYYPENFIRGKLNFTQGEVYNAEKLEETQLRLYDLGIFYSVNFNSILNSSPPEVVPVRLKITEAKRFKTTLGVGYGKDEKFRTVVEFTLLGFLKGPGRINFEARKSAIEEFTLRLGYTHPEFLWERTTLRLITFSSKVNEIAYGENSLGFNIGAFRRFTKSFLSSVTYILENVTLDVNSIAIQDDTSLVKDNYNKSGIGLMIQFSSAEPFSSPEKGFTISLSTTYSGIGLGSPYKFFKSIIDIRKYSRVFDEMVAGLRLSAGYLESFNDPKFIPVEERFYLGGSSSVRGWERFMLSPLDLNGKPKGGSSFLLGSFELRVPSFEKIYGVLFLDFGNVWEPSLTYKVNELQYAAGIGLRYETPIGPLRIDAATPIFNDNREIQFWFNIGHAF